MKCSNCGHDKEFHEGDGDDDRPKGYCCYMEEDLVTDCECDNFIQ